MTASSTEPLESKWQGTWTKAPSVGYVSSVVHPSQLPQEDGQANFPIQDAPYAVTSDGLVVLVENNWTLFEALNEAETAE